MKRYAFTDMSSDWGTDWNRTRAHARERGEAPPQDFSGFQSSPEYSPAASRKGCEQERLANSSSGKGSHHSQAGEASQVGSAGKGGSASQSGSAGQARSSKKAKISSQERPPSQGTDHSLEKSLDHAPVEPIVDNIYAGKLGISETGWAVALHVGAGYHSKMNEHKHRALAAT